MTTEYIDAAAPSGITKPRFGRTDEARLLRRLIRHLRPLGFRVHSLAIGGEGYVRTPSERAAVCEVFEWDAYVTLRFKKAGAPRLYGALLVTGNGRDIISDYTCDTASISEPDPGSFVAAMHAFDTAEDAREV